MTGHGYTEEETILVTSGTIVRLVRVEANYLVRVKTMDGKFTKVLDPGDLVFLSPLEYLAMEAEEPDEE